MGQRSVGNSGQLIEQLLRFGEFSGIEQTDRAGKNTQIAGPLIAIHAIRFVAPGCFLHQDIGESVSDSPGCAQLLLRNTLVLQRAGTGTKVPDFLFFQSGKDLHDRTVSSAPAPQFDPVPSIDSAGAEPAIPTEPEQNADAPADQAAPTRSIEYVAVIHLTRTWVQYGVFGFAVLCIVIGAVEALFGR